MVRSQLLGQAGGFFCRQSSHRPQVRELWEVGRDIIQRRHSVSPPGRNFLSVYHKKSRCNTRAHYAFHLPFRTAEAVLPAQQIHKLKDAPSTSREFGEYYGRPITESESLQRPIREILWELGVDIGAICPRQLNNKQEYMLAQILRDAQWDEDWGYNDEDEELDSTP